ncbi:DUF4340 domain-containing protein [Priestia koreensis]|uniref:DUF4340 domain-containing protein n=1 Tax=Priestia koreensis TaxID=284581 RepID=UPI00203DCC99|nr:DUF4340 domain-containing protein [Priestia koreensis]MCM3006079.1 hypothetical protein [Priestia koreensis]
MKRIFFLALFLAFLSLFAFGCQSKEASTESTVKSSPTSESNKSLSIDNNFTRITVSKPKGFNKTTFEDQESLKTFADIFSRAVKEPGKVDMDIPQVYIEVVYDKDKQQSLYLRIGEKGQRSTFMKPDDTSTIYTVPNKITDKLIKLVGSQYK